MSIKFNLEAVPSPIGKYVSTVDYDTLQEQAIELENALRNVHDLISEGAKDGFNLAKNDWGERLFHSQQKTSAALERL